MAQKTNAQISKNFMVLCRRYRARGKVIKVCKNPNCTMYNFKSPLVGDN